MGFDVRTGQEALDVPHRFRARANPATRRGWATPRQYTGNAGIWGPFSADPAARLRVSEHRVGDQRRLRRPPARQQPLLQLAGVPRHQDRQDDLVPAAGASRHLGLRHAAGADPDRHHRRREAGEGRGAADEAGVSPTSSTAPTAARCGRGRRRRCRKTDVPREWTSPTQPIPSKPPAFDLQGITENDLIDFTPELRAEAIKALQGSKLGPIYTPPTLVTPTNKGTIVMPGLRRRCELARRRRGSGDRLRLRRLDDQPDGHRAEPNDATAPRSRVDTDYTMGGALPTVRGCASSSRRTAASPPTT